MVKCFIEGCGGEYRSSGLRYNKYIVKDGQYVRLPKNSIIRTRICDKCGHKDITIEYPVERMIKDTRLISGLKKLIKEYMR